MSVLRREVIGWQRIRGAPSQLLRLLLPRRTVHSRGLRFSLQCDNPITQYRWETYNEKEPETLDWIDRWMSHDDTLFDVGANIGIYTMYAALRHPGMRVIAFEPEYANLHLLRDNLVQNGLASRVAVYSMALGDRTGISQLHIQDFTPGAALHTESRSPLTVTRTHRPVIWSEGICTFTLDAFCQETGLHPTCIKMDVDGTELEILHGASRTLRFSSFRTILLELFGGGEVREGCGRLLREAGLRRVWAGPEERPNEIWVRDLK